MNMNINMEPDLTFISEKSWRGLLSCLGVGPKFLRHRTFHRKPMKAEEGFGFSWRLWVQPCSASCATSGLFSTSLSSLASCKEKSVCHVQNDASDAANCKSIHIPFCKYSWNWHIFIMFIIFHHFVSSCGPSCCVSASCSDIRDTSRASSSKSAPPAVAPTSTAEGPEGVNDICIQHHSKSSKTSETGTTMNYHVIYVMECYINIIYNIILHYTICIYNHIFCIMECHLLYCPILYTILHSKSAIFSSCWIPASGGASKRRIRAGNWRTNLGQQKKSLSWATNYQNMANDDRMSSI